MKKYLLSLFILGLPSLAVAQSGGASGVGVRQHGTVTPGDCTSWFSTNVVQDAGSACGGGGGSGTVTSLTAGTGLSASPTTITTTGSYSLLQATTTTLGGVIVGNNLSISTTGVLSASGSSISLTTTGSSGAAQLNGTSLNIPVYGSAPGGATNAIQNNAGSSTFGGSSTGNGLYISTTNPTQINFLNNVTTGALIGLPDNGLDTSSVFVGPRALLQETTTNLGNTAVGNGAGSAITNGSNNEFFGDGAGSGITTGVQSVVIGNSSISGTSGLSYSVLIGVGLGVSSGAISTVVIGNSAGGGPQGVIIGQNSGNNTMGGNNNIIVGYTTGQVVTSGNGDIILGATANAALFNTASAIAIGTAAIVGTGDIGIGYKSLAGTTTNNNDNTALGFDALTATTSAAGSVMGNVAVGYSAGALNTTGTGNIDIGYNTGSTVGTIGSNNILIGNSLALSTSSTSNTINVGGIYTVTGTGTASTAANTLNGTLALPNIASDTGLTDATVCEDTTLHVLHSGSGTLGTCLGTSSARYKMNIVDVPPSLQNIMKLRPVNFNFIDTSHGDPKKKQFGFIAEDAAPVFPDLVRLDGSGQPNTFDYLGLIAPIVKAIQEQQGEINSLPAIQNDPCHSFNWLGREMFCK